MQNSCSDPVFIFVLFCFLFNKEKGKFICVSVDAIKNISHPWLVELTDVEPTDMGG